MHRMSPAVLPSWRSALHLDLAVAGFPRVPSGHQALEREGVDAGAARSRSAWVVASRPHRALQPVAGSIIARNERVLPLWGSCDASPPRSTRTRSPPVPAAEPGVVVAASAAAHSEGLAVHLQRVERLSAVSIEGGVHPGTASSGSVASVMRGGERPSRCTGISAADGKVRAQAVHGGASWRPKGPALALVAPLRHTPPMKILGLSSKVLGRARGSRPDRARAVDEIQQLNQVRAWERRGGPVDPGISA